MKGKRIFSAEETSQIIALIAEKLISDSNKQKSIRNKIRALGFYASDFGLRNGYTEQDFLKVIELFDMVDIKPLVAINQLKLQNTHLPNKTLIKVKNDECYIVDLCDEILKEKGLRQHRFEFLRGDSGKKLPVDVY